MCPMWSWYGSNYKGKGEITKGPSGLYGKSDCSKAKSLRAHIEHSRCRKWSSASVDKASQRWWKGTGASHSDTEGTHLQLGATQTWKGKCMKFGRRGVAKSKSRYK